jgi:ribulose-phosphate 3-epimerase
VREVAGDIDLLLIMSVNPGFGGQDFIAASIGKVERARRMLDDTRSRAMLEVDGGVASATIASLHRAGADTFVAGNAIFSAPAPLEEISRLRSLCSELV